jgi:hypothetical protein
LKSWEQFALREEFQSFSPDKQKNCLADLKRTALPTFKPIILHPQKKYSGLRSESNHPNT